MGSGVYNVLVSSHVIRSEIDAHSPDLENLLLNDFNSVSLGLRVLCFVTIKISGEKAREEMVF